MAAQQNGHSKADKPPAPAGVSLSYRFYRLTVVSLILWHFGHPGETIEAHQTALGNVHLIIIVFLVMISCVICVLRVLGNLLSGLV